MKNNNNLTEIKNKDNKIEELLKIIDKKDKEIEQIKNKNLNTNTNNINEDSSKYLHKISDEEFEEMKTKYESVIKDLENYKLINNKLLEEINEKEKIIDEYNNYSEEKNNLNKNIDDLKDIIIKKDSENKELKIINQQLEIELKKNRKEERTERIERNPFKRNALNDEFELQKNEDFRYSLGAKESRELIKTMKEYKEQFGKDLSQMNILKSEIKSCNAKLKEKDNNLKEIKRLIEIGYKGINPSNKGQKEAIKKLKEYLKIE